MSWTSVAPRGTISVKANRPLLAGNTTYIEQTMGNQVVGTNTDPQTAQDHFWDVDAAIDGRHRMINMPKFTVDGVGTEGNPTKAASCDGVIFLKTANADIGRIEGFYTNADNTYQFIPSLKSGTTVVTENFTTIIDLPDNSYGEIFMWRDTFGRYTSQAGFFKCHSGVCEAYAYGLRISGGSTIIPNLIYGNGPDADNLNLVVRRAFSDIPDPSTWQYRITYRAM